MADEPQPHPSLGFVARADQPLIALPLGEGDGQVVSYFVDDEAADAAAEATTLQQALGVIGAWEEIDAPDALDKLDRIRHQSRPTPPIHDL